MGTTTVWYHIFALYFVGGYDANRCNDWLYGFYENHAIECSHHACPNTSSNAEAMIGYQALSEFLKSSNNGYGENNCNPKRHGYLDHGSSY